MQGRVIANRPTTIVFRARKTEVEIACFTMYNCGFYLYLGRKLEVDGQYTTQKTLWDAQFFHDWTTLKQKKKFWIIIDRSCRVLLQYPPKLTFVISLFSTCGRINTMYRKKNCSMNIILLFSPQSSGGLELHYIRLKLKLLTVANLYFLLGW